MLEIGPSNHYHALLADAGWSSLAARRAHNPKVAGSNPAPATNFIEGPAGPFFMSLVYAGDRSRRVDGVMK